MALLVAELGHQCAGLDISESMLAQAKIKANQLGYQVTFGVRDAENLPVGDQAFDMVMCLVENATRSTHTGRTCSI